MTHGDRRHGAIYIPEPSAVGDTASLICTLSKSTTKKIVKMSPNVGFETLQSFSPRRTVAKRKEALEFRKVSKGFVLLLCFLIYIYIYLTKTNFPFEFSIKNES